MKLQEWVEKIIKNVEQHINGEATDIQVESLVRENLKAFVQEIEEELEKLEDRGKVITTYKSKKYVYEECPKGKISKKKLKEFLENLFTEIKIIHRQKPASLIGTSFCGNFQEGDMITVIDENITCKKCKKLTKNYKWL